MYLYKVGYYSYEECQYYEYSHETEYSKDEFYDICRKCIVKVAKKFVSKFDDPDAHVYMSENGFRFADIAKEDLDEEMAAKGFTRVKYKACYALDGWDSLCNDTKFNSMLDAENEESYKLAELMPKSLKKKALAIGKRMAKERVKELKTILKDKKRAHKRTGKDTSVSENV